MIEKVDNLDGKKITTVRDLVGCDFATATATTSRFRFQHAADIKIACKSGLQLNIPNQIDRDLARGKKAIT